MSKRDTETKHTNDGTITPNASGASTANALEQRVVAFAEQLGRIAGTVQAKAEGWMDRETLNEQIAGVRDGAADLLKQLAEGTTKVSKKKRFLLLFASRASSTQLRNLLPRKQP